MKTLFLPFLFVPYLLCAQAEKPNQTSAFIGVMSANTYFHTSEDYHAFNTTGSSRYRGGNLHDGRSIGLGLGLSRKLHPRWEAAGRFNFTGGETSDTLTLYNFERYGLENEQIRTRHYRAFWTEALIFWRVVGERSLVDLQLGTGLAYMASAQHYDSGFTYAADLDLFTYRKTFEKRHGFGLPIHFQFQYPINYHFKVGSALQLNTYFDGRRRQANLTAFVAYRW